MNGANFVFEHPLGAITCCITPSGLRWLRLPAPLARDRAPRREPCPYALGGVLQDPCDRSGFVWFHRGLPRDRPGRVDTSRHARHGLDCHTASRGTRP